MRTIGEVKDSSDDNASQDYKEYIRNSSRQRESKRLFPSEEDKILDSDQESSIPNGLKDEMIVVSSGKLFCSVCREELSLKLSIIKNHV